MRRVPDTAILLPGAALATMAALLLVVGGERSPEPFGSPLESASVNPATSENAVPPDLLAAPWFVQTFDFASESELPGFRLQVGLLDGTVTRDVIVGLANLNPSSEWSGAPPFAGGPYAGRVLYGYFDGTVSTLRLVSAEDGNDRLVLESDMVVHQAVLDPLTDAFYYLALDPITRREVGIFRGTLPGGETEQLVPARASADATQIASRLFLTPDGTRLVSHDCRDDDCRLRSYVAVTGDLIFDVAAPASDPVGITDADMILSGASASVGEGCPEVPCPAIAFDLDSGLRRPVGKVCGAATIVDGPDGPILVGGAEQAPPCGHGPIRIIASDIPSDAVVAELPLLDSRELVVNTRDQAVELPAGWFLVGNAGQFYTLEPAAQQDALTLVTIDRTATFDLPAVSLAHR